MSCKMTRQQRLARRSQIGSIAEFAPALTILIFFVVIPLLDLTIVPVRWMLAHELLNDYSRKLALCETFSQSYSAMNADPSLQNRLQNLGGVTVESLRLTLRISRVFKEPHPEEVLVVTSPGQIPPAWLPDGAKAPCSYALNVEIQSKMAPAIMVPIRNVYIPGLSAPIPLTISSSHEWENFGRNPANGKYFLNE